MANVEPVEPNGETMGKSSGNWISNKERVLKEIGDGNVVLVRQEMMGSPPKPAIERLRGEFPNGKRASVWWFQLPYKHNRNMILPPVSIGCELRQLGEVNCGWRTGCKFCTVGRGPFEEYFSPQQMLELIRLALEKSRLASDFWTKDGNLVVFFSSGGEPLLHYKAVSSVIRRLRQIFGQSLFVSISTVGIAKGIEALIADKDLRESGLKIQLRLSLHFTTDEERRKYMPVVDDIATVLGLGVQYAKVSHTPLMVKYTLIQDVNDSDRHARELVQLLMPYRDYVWVRIARLNPYGGDLKPPSRERRNHFRAILIRAGFRTVKVWKGFATLGCDISHYSY